MNKQDEDKNPSELIPQSGKKIALVGNPNVGKSILFNYLTGIYVEVSNFPGTTVEIYHGNYKKYVVYDTPGIYSVSSFNDEEKVARDIIIDADIIINVVDAAHLERDLFLTQQLIDMQKKVVVALNMFDELEKNNIALDVAKLSGTLGVPVIPTVAPEHKGFKELELNIDNACQGNITTHFRRIFNHAKDLIPASELVLLLEEDEPAIQKYLNNFNFSGSRSEHRKFRHKRRHGKHRMHRHDQNPVSESDSKTEEQPNDSDKSVLFEYLGAGHQLKNILRHFSGRDNIYLRRRLYVNSIIDNVLSTKSGKQSLSKKIGNLIINPVTGIPISLLILYLVYLFIGVIVAGNVVNFTEGYLGNEIYEKNVKEFIAANSSTEIALKIKNENDSVIYAASHLFSNGTAGEKETYNSIMSKKTDNAEVTYKFTNPVLTILFGEFGILTMTVTYILFLLLPLVLGFYLMLSILEDSGYLPRLATLVDKLLSYVGLNGRAVIPIILGFGCVTMATITTRILGSKRERTIATTILQLAIPCSAQLGVIATLLAAAKTEITLIYVLIIFSFLTLIGTVLNKFIKGESSPLIIDLPPMRMPKLMNVAKKTYYRSFGFMKEASPWFFFGALLISVMQVTGALKVAINLLHPLVVHWLKLPSESAIAFVMGLVRRDFGAAGLYGLPLNSYQILVAIVTLTLFVPCVTSLIVMFKERGSKEGLIIWLGSLTFAFFIGGIVAQIFL